MVSSAWHPTDEHMAISGLGVFTEWLRATARLPDATPGLALTWALTWATTSPPDFAAAVAAFMGWPNPQSPRLAHRPAHSAIVRIERGRRTTAPYDAIPPWATETLRAADPIALAIFHILHNNTRPDDRLLWMGAADDALPLGALFVGATVILADDPTSALASAEGAQELHPAGKAGVLLMAPLGAGSSESASV